MPFSQPRTRRAVALVAALAALAALFPLFPHRAAAQTQSQDCAVFEGMLDRSGQALNWTRGSCCSYTAGFTCVSGRITAATLGGRGLTGTIPDLSILTKLETLQLYQNALSGTIPALTALSQLAWLSLWSNRLTGQLPASLSSLTQLGRIDVSDNLLTGPLPSLTALTRLTDLYVDRNNLSGSVDGLLPSSLTTCSLTYRHTNVGLFTCGGSVPKACNDSSTSLQYPNYPITTSSSGCAAPGLNIAVIAGAAAGGVVVIALGAFLVRRAVRGCRARARAAEKDTFRSTMGYAPGVAHAYGPGYQGLPGSMPGGVIPTMLYSAGHSLGALEAGPAPQQMLGAPQTPTQPLPPPYQAYGTDTAKVAAQPRPAGSGSTASPAQQFTPSFPPFMGPPPSGSTQQSPTSGTTLGYRSVDVGDLQRLAPQGQSHAPHWAFVAIVGPQFAGQSKVAIPEEYRAVEVAFEYNAAGPDELTARPGQLFKISTVFCDGWAQGKTIPGEAVGLLPLDCLRIAPNQPAFAGPGVRFESVAFRGGPGGSRSAYPPPASYAAPSAPPPTSSAIQEPSGVWLDVRGPGDA